MPDLHPPFLTDRELDTFREKGYLRLGHVVADDRIRSLCQRIDDIMLGKIRYDHMLMQLCPSAGQPELSLQTRAFKGSSLKYRKIEDLDQDPLFLDYMQHALFRNITRKLIGEQISVFRSMFFNKPAEQGITINWHQDGADGWGLDIRPKITVWSALDTTCVANGCLQIIPGSHKGIIPEHGDDLSPEEILLHAPDEKRLFLELESGEVVLLDNMTLHRSEVNTTNRPRRAFSVCYIDAATQHVASGSTFPIIFPKYVPVHGAADRSNY